MLVCAALLTQMLPVSAAHADTPTTTRYEETSPLITWQGAWQSTQDPSLSGGSYAKATGGPAQSALVSFTGTGVTWIGSKANSFGIASVSVDGAKPTLVDLYAPSNLYQQPLWDAGTLPNGPHTLRIDWSNSKDASSTGTAIAVDAFDVAGSLTQARSWTRYDDNAAGITYSSNSTWNTTSNGCMLGGSYHWAQAAGSSANIFFSGKHVDWIGATGPGYGLAQVSIDGTNTQTIDSYSPSLLYNQVLFSSPALSDGPHVLTVTDLNAHDSTSTGTNVVADAFDIDGTITVPTRYEQTDSRLATEGAPWNTSTDSAASAGTYAASRNFGSTYDVAFTGTGITWLAEKGGCYGIASVSLDGGSPQLVDLYSANWPEQVAAWSTSGLSYGLHTLKIAWTGLKNAAATDTYASVDAFDVVGTLTQATPTRLRYEETSPLITWQGAWQNAQDPSLSGGSYAQATGPAQSALVSFTGTGITWIGSKANYFGIATVSLDGAKPISVDLYAPSNLYQQPLWDAGALTNGPHTLRIDWSNSKDASSTGTAIAVDAFDVAGSLTQAPVWTRYDDNATGISYSSSTSWGTYSNSSMYGGAYRCAASVGSSANIFFSGKHIDWVGATGPGYGLAQVSIDGTNTQTIDSYSPSLLYNQLMYSSPTLSNGPHVLTVTTLGSHDSSSTGSNVLVDAFDIDGTITVPTRYEQTDSRLATEGAAWTVNTDSSSSNGTYAVSRNFGSTYDVAFTGTGITWDAERGTCYGIASVSLDGGPPQFVDLYCPNWPYQAAVWSASGLADGPHTVKIAWTGLKNAAATDTYVSVDAFDIVGTLTQATPTRLRYEETSPLITWQGAWQNTLSTSLSGGAYYRASGAGQSALVSFTGSSITWIASKASSYGIASVSLDGVKPVLVDLYAPTSLYQQAVWDSGTLTNGPHTLRIDWTNSKDASSTGSSVGVDAFDVAGVLTQAPSWTRYDDNATGMSYSSGSSWGVFSNSNMYGGAYHCATASGSSANIFFSGKHVDWIGTTGPTYGLAQVSIDETNTKTIDSYSPSTLYNQVLFSSPTLSDGPHVLTVTTLGSHDSSSTGTNMVADAVDIDGTITVPTRYDDPDPHIAYSGSWSVISDSNLYGGSYHTVTGAGRQCVVRFSGTSLTWVSPMAQNYGWALVTVDGAATTTVDQYRSSYLGGLPVWTTGQLADGVHTVRIQPLGSKDASATDSRIVIDAFDVVGTVLNADTTPPLTTCDATATYLATATINLTATDDLSGVAATHWRLDGSSWVTGTVVSATSVGTHFVDFYSVDQMSNAESTKSVTFTVATRYDDPDPHIAYSGSWSVISDSNLYGGSYHTVTGAGRQCVVRFSGTSLTWVSPMAQNYGWALVTVDGAATTTVDQYRSSYLGGLPVWTTGQLADGVHTVRIQPLGSKDASATDSRIVIDAFDVAGTLVNADVTAPVTTDNAPSDWARGPVVVSLVASDSGSGVAATCYSTDGTTPTVPYTGAFVIGAQGVTTLRYYSVDAAGNTEAVTTKLISLDDAAPNTAISSLPQGWASHDVTFTLSATDGVSGLAATHYRVNGGEYRVYDGTPAVVSTEGTNSIECYSVDKAGNVETNRSAAVLLDKTPPAISGDATGVLSASGWYTGTVDVHFTATDGLSGLATVSPDVRLSSEGASRTAQGVATDAAGNAATCTVSDINIDDEPPATSSDASAAYSGQATINLTAADDLSGVSATYFSLDGGLTSSVGTLVATATPGAYTLTYWSVDTAGNCELPHATAFMIEASHVAPSTVISGDHLGAWTNSVPATFTLSATPSPGGSGVAATFYRLGSSEPATYSDTPVAVTAEGTTSVSYWSVDGQGDVEPTQTANVLIDTTSPVTSSDATASYVSQAVIHLFAHDALSGVDSTRWMLDGASGFGTVVTTILPGAHNLSWASVDNATNAETTHSVAFSVLPLVAESGDISQDTTWTSESQYVIRGTVTVDSGVRLAIEPGTIVKFDGADANLVAAGTLEAQGTDAAPILFTSFADDVGGDDNCDGSFSRPARGDWGSIELQTSASHLTDCRVSFGGSSGSELHITNPVPSTTIAPTVAHSIIASSGSAGVLITSGWHAYSTRAADGMCGLQLSESTVTANAGNGVDFGSYNSAATITSTTVTSNGGRGISAQSAPSFTVSGCTISGNGKEGIWAGIAYWDLDQVLYNNLPARVSFFSCPTLIGNVINDNGDCPIRLQDSVSPVMSNNSGTGNGVDAIMLSGVHRSYAPTFEMTAQPLVYSFDNWQIVGGRVDVQPGVVVKSLQGRTCLVASGQWEYDSGGSLCATGAVFTSIADDSDGRDTDHTNAAGASVHWDGIEVQTSTSSFADCRLSYGGSSGSELHITNPVPETTVTPSVTHSIIASSAGVGVLITSGQHAYATRRADGMCGLLLSESTVTANAGNGIDFGWCNSAATITTTTVTANGGCGISARSVPTFTVSGCTISNNVQQGIWVGTAQCSPWDIDYGFYADRISLLSDPRLIGNIIDGNGAEGISFADPVYPSTIIVSGGSVAHNAGNGVTLGSRVEPTITGVDISGNHARGLSVDSASSLSVADCTISANTAQGLWIGENTLQQPSVHDLVGNVISGNGADGLQLADTKYPSTLEVAGGVVDGNLGNGITLGSGVETTITGATITSDGARGVSVGTGRPLAMSGCTVSGNANEGIWVAPTTLPQSVSHTLTNMVVDGNGGDGLKFVGTSGKPLSDYPSLLSVSDSSFGDNAANGILLQLSSETSITGSLFCANHNDGVYSTADSADISYCTASNNLVDGVNLRNGTIQHSTSSGNLGYGIVATDGCAIVTTSTISGNHRDGILLADSGIVTDCTLAANKSAGVRATGGVPSVGSCSFTDNAGDAINVDPAATVGMNGNTGTGNGINGIRLLGERSVSIPQLLPVQAPGASNGLDYVIDDYVTDSGTSVSFGPGAVAKFPEDSAWTVQGNLNAPSVTFTSLKDDSVGNNADTDGKDDVAPARGDWLGLLVQSRSPNGVAITDSHVVYGGGSGASLRVDADSGAPTVARTEILHGSGKGIELLTGAPNITDCTIADNTGDAMSFDPRANPGDVTGNRGTGNGLNGIRLFGERSSVAELSLPLQAPGRTDGLDYVIDNYVTDSATTVTFGPGATAKFSQDSTWTVHGNLTAPEVVFTSLRDEAHGNNADTDGKDDVQPARGDWSALEVSDAGSVSITDSKILYGGGTGAALRVLGSNPSVLDTNFTNNVGDAINVDPHSTPVMSGDTGCLNDINGIRLWGERTTDALQSLPAQAPRQLDGLDYVIDHYTTDPGTNVVFGPEAVAKFSDGSSWSVQGTLAASHVTFTSLKDDAHGNNPDTNGDGTDTFASSPVKGDWGVISLTPSSDASITDSSILYGGGAPGGNVVIDNCSPVITDTTLRHGTGIGIQVLAGTPQIKDDTITDYNGDAINIDPSATVDMSGNDGSGNGVNGIRLWGSRTVSLIQCLPAQGLDYVIDHYDCGPSTTVTFGPDAVAKFPAGSSWTVHGNLTAPNVTFTSLKDDAHGNNADTDGKDDVPPAPGNWSALTLSDAHSVSITGCTILYGGGAPGGNVVVDNCSPVITDTMLARGTGMGIQVLSGSPQLKRDYISEYASDAINVDPAATVDMSGNDGSANGINGVRLWGERTTSATETLPAQGLDYVIDNYTTDSGTDVTFGPGAAAKFPEHSSWTVHGNLTAPQVTFTSLADDANGNNADTNGDGHSAGHSGDWGRLYFASSGNVSLTGSEVRYAGDMTASNGDAICVENSSPKITATDVEACDHVGIHVVSGAPAIKSCTFADNGGIAMVLDPAATPDMSCNDGSGNATNGIKLWGERAPGSPALQLPAQGLDYVIGDYTTDGGSTVTLGAGAVAKFYPDASWTVHGTLNASGVTFTSLADDAHGNNPDTNGDGSSSGSPGAWGALVLASPNVTLKNATLLYGGGAGQPGEIRVAWASPAIDRTTVGSSASSGIYSVGYSPQITACTLSDNAGSGVQMSNGTLTGSSVEGNKSDGVVITAGSPVFKGNTIDQNKSGWAARIENDATPDMADNAGRGNKVDAIVFTGTRYGGSLTLIPQPLVYGVDSYALNSGNLSFEPGPSGSNGPVVKFLSGSSNLTLNGGSVDAQHAVFTSVHDDSVGNSTDDGGRGAAVGDWAGIRVNGGDLSLSNSDVLWAGAPASVYAAGGTTTLSGDLVKNGSAVGVQSQPGATLNVFNSTVTLNGGDGVDVSDGGLVSGCLVSGNTGNGILVTAGAPTVTNNQVSGSGAWAIGVEDDASPDMWASPNASGGGNHPNAIVLDGNRSFGDLDLVPQAMPYSVANYTIGSGASVTFESGCVVTAVPDGLINVDGGLTAHDTVFTPSNGSWSGIAVDGSADFNDCSISSAGSGQNGAITVGGTGSLGLQRCTVDHSSSAGIWADSGGSVDIENSYVLHSGSDGVVLGDGTGYVNNSGIGWNGGNGVHADNGSPSITSSSIYDNSGFGLFSSGGNASPFVEFCDFSGNGDVAIRNYAGSPCVTESNFNGSGQKVSSSPNKLTSVDGNYWGSLTGPSSDDTRSADVYSFSTSPLAAGPSGAIGVGSAGGGANGGSVSGGNGWSWLNPAAALSTVLGALANMWGGFTQGISGFEPVNMSTGNFYTSATDIALPGKGPALVFSRTYNSQDQNPGPLGYGWTDSYQTRLILASGTSDVVVVGSDGRHLTYTTNGASFTPPNSIRDTLVKNPDHSFDLKSPDQSSVHFDSTGRMTSETDRSGNKLTLAYDGATSNLLSVTAAGARTLTFTYDSSRQHITKVTDSANRSVTYGYNPATSDLTTVTDVDGQVSTYTYDTSHQITAAYSPQHPAAPYVTNTYRNGQVTSQRDGYGSMATINYDPTNGVTTATDNRGFQSQYHFDTEYRSTEVQDNAGYTTSCTYDSTTGQVATTTDARHNTTAFAYDAGGNPTSVTDPAGHISTAHYDSANNNLLWAKDADNFQTTYGYDSTGKWLTSVSDPAGVTTTFDHNPSDGQVTAMHSASATVSYSYDASGNATGITDPLNNTTTIEHDAAGRVLSTTDPLHRKVSFTYSPQGKPLSVTDPLGRSVTMGYDADSNVTSVTDARSVTTTFTYDVMDNLTAVTDALQNTTTYTYDRNSNLASVRNARGKTSRYTYNPNNQPESATDALGSTWSFAYDAAGNPVSTTFPDGQSTLSTYTADNLLHEVTAGTLGYTYAYTPGRRLTSVTDGNGGTYSYGYDTAGRTDTSADNLDASIPGGFKVSTGYDPAGRVGSTVVPGEDGSRTYGYDLRSALSTITLPSDPAGQHTTFSYDAAGELTSQSAPDGSISSLGYDAAGRLTSLVTTMPSGVLAYRYERNENGNVTAENSTRFGYDALNRLSSWYDPGTDATTDYTYDAAYNLTGASVGGTKTKSFTFDAADRISNVGYSYDANGNMTSDGNQTYRYDELNRLTSVLTSTGATIAAYAYDYLNRRTSATDASGTTTYFHYDGASANVIAETDGAGHTTATYAWAGGSPVAMTRGGQTSYYHTNAHGDVVALTNASGDVVASYTYDPWGCPLTQTGSVVNPYRYAGYRYDSATGLYYLLNRYYSPDSCRFVTRDLLPGDAKAPATMNHYAYCLGDPVNRVDPSGLMSAAASVGMFIGCTARGSAIVVGCLGFAGATSEFWLFAGAFVAGYAVTTALLTWAGAPTGWRKGDAGWLLATGLVSGIASFGGAAVSGAGKTPVGVGAGGGEADVGGDGQGFPSRALPRDENGVPQPESPYPHTELGTRTGRAGTYPQAREFGEDGTLVRDIDFTDHGTPDIHPNPHQHVYVPNASGGTPNRGDGIPLQ